ncbi:PQQ-binding-like beta-propeller repeat protein [Nocardioides sp. cx-173]|uniref:outer membrane protein assembly factor BamB family protein n=1 Tax=Nocardioides sp. cx-173 TaxID=2898796 RepID=UPI001E5B51F2|nr:PQQ-binding-like beta-propeller repeat protein [Nocardioides sp. cx-173]MCD4523888.1 PQQ-like beta-propeller repeat protein [Nocardioides sp. cx-173]UGB41793.1 PQQ-like beta-propeller repeat protein [Nocardioides sp. cx-173]
MTNLRGKRLPLVVSGVLVVAGLGVWQGIERWQSRCSADGGTSVSMDEVDAGSGLPLVAADELDPTAPYDDGSVPLDRVRALRSAALERLPRLGAPLGELESGMWTSGMEVDPVVLVDGADAVTVVDSGGGPDLGFYSWFGGVDLPAGELRWMRGFEHDSAPGLGLLDDRLVTLSHPGGRAPRVAAYDPASGEELSCVWLTGDFDSPPPRSLDLDDVDGEVIVVHETGASDGGLRLSRVDPADGEVGFQEDLELARADELRVVGDLAVLSETAVTGASGGGGNLRERAVARATTGQGQSWPSGVEARDAGSGELRWTYPADADDPLVASVVGGDDETGAVLLEVMECACEDGAQDVATTLVAVGPDGEPLWEKPAPSTIVAVWGDLAVMAVNDEESNVLVAWSLADGSERWRAPVTGPNADAEVDRAEEVDGTWLVPQYAVPGLLLVDEETGETRRRDTGMVVSEIEVNDEHVLLSAGGGLFVLARD